MMKFYSMKKVLLFSVLILSSLVASGQKGFLRGTITDGETGEGLIGATVYKQGTSIGAVADFDGNYSLMLEPGQHTIIVQFVSYQTQTINDVVIKPGEVTMLDLTLSSEVAELAEIVISADYVKGNDNALLAIQKKSPNVVNGISSQAFRKLGDSDLGDAMKRVTGVSVEGGKYVYVRGLGDRYTKTTLNGMMLPGLDPDRNTVQMDIFPTGSIENVMVFKTFTPDLQGDFTGGMIDIETKNFPEEKTTSISLETEFNPDMHFKNDFISYGGSATDFVGFDNGMRSLPFRRNLDIPDISSPTGFIVEDITRAFSPEMGVKNKSSFMNYSINFMHGNQINRAKATWGYNIVLGYKNRTELYSDTEFGEYIKNTDPTVTDLDGYKIRRGPVAGNDVLWNVLLSGALKYQNHSFSMVFMHNQNGISQSTDRTTTDLEDNPSTLIDDILTWTQRQVSSGIIGGQHHFKRIDLEWKGSLTYARIYEPDFRSTRIERIPLDNPGGEGPDFRYSLNTGVGAGINRFWRNMNEMNESVKVDLSYKYGEHNMLKAGGLALLKQRDFSVLNYSFRVKNRGNITISPNPDDYFLPGNIWTVEKNEGTYIVSRSSEVENAVNAYNAESDNYGTYLMAEQYLGKKLRAIVGVRAEIFKMYYTGRDQRGGEMIGALTLDELNWLPSVNLVYELNESMNMRASFNKTLARPSFKEKSNAQIYDPISDRTTIGNPGLQQTSIANYDLRWEYYFGHGEMASFAFFYKSFDGHIEKVAFQTAPDQLTWQNAGKSFVYGIEAEVRKELFRGILIGSNFSLIKSGIDMNDVIVNEDAQGNMITEKENREIWARSGERIGDTRNMVGQAPWMINAFINWHDKGNTWNANVSYNVQGRTLSVIGSGRWPDIYTVPFHSLNFNLYKDLGRSRIGFRITNILDSDRQEVYESFGAEDKTFSLFSPGRAFALSYKFNF